MGMRTIGGGGVVLNNQQERTHTYWHNWRDYELKLKFYGNNGPLQPLVLAPGDEVQLDSAYDNRIKVLCGCGPDGKPHLKRGRAPKPDEAPAAPAEAPSKPAEEPGESAAPAEAEAPSKPLSRQERRAQRRSGRGS